MFYLDTSVIMAYYCPEPLSERAEDFMTGVDRPAISALTEVELVSAISRRVRQGKMSRTDGGRVIAEFLSHVSGLYYTRLLITPQHYQLARDWIGRFEMPLRTLDALHLAVSSSEGLTIVTADETLTKSAETLSLEVLLLTPG